MASRFSNDEIAFQALADSGPDPSVAKLWDFELGEMRVEAFETYLSSASHGEALFAKFLAVVWFGQDRYGLDIAEVATVLDIDARERLAQWIRAPIWP